MFRYFYYKKDQKVIEVAKNENHNQLCNRNKAYR